MDAFLYVVKFSANPSFSSNIRTAKLGEIGFIAGGRKRDKVLPKVTVLVEYRTQPPSFVGFGDRQR